MKTYCLVVCSIFALLVIPTSGQAADAPTSSGDERPSTGTAQLHPIDDSRVLATIHFADDGVNLLVTGVATGLDPGETYLTLIYDNGSVAGGPRACAPTIFDPGNPDFLLATMLVGFWEVDDDGVGTLTAINTNNGADFVPLEKFRNTSVRRFIAPPPAPGAPPVTELVACGHVASNRRPVPNDDSGDTER